MREVMNVIKVNEVGYDALFSLRCLTILFKVEMRFCKYHLMAHH